MYESMCESQLGLEEGASVAALCQKVLAFIFLVLVVPVFDLFVDRD